MIYLNGIKCETIEEVELQLASIQDEYTKECIRNDFLGIPNTPIFKIPNVTPRQIRIALILSNISLDSIAAAVDALPEPQRSIARTTWEYSTEVQRNNPLLNSLAPSLGFTQEQLDQLFLLAATL